MFSSENVILLSIFYLKCHTLLFWFRRGYASLQLFNRKYYQSDKRRSADSVKDLSEDEKVFVNRKTLRCVESRLRIGFGQTRVGLETEVGGRATRVADIEDDGVGGQVGPGDEVRKAEEEGAETHHDEARWNVLGLWGANLKSNLPKRWKI